MAETVDDIINRAYQGAFLGPDAVAEQQAPVSTGLMSSRVGTTTESDTNEEERPASALGWLSDFMKRLAAANGYNAKGAARSGVQVTPDSATMNSKYLYDKYQTPLYDFLRNNESGVASDLSMWVRQNPDLSGDYLESLLQGLQDTYDYREREGITRSPSREGLTIIGERPMTDEELAPFTDTPIEAEEMLPAGLMSRGSNKRGLAGDPNKKQFSTEEGDVFDARETQRKLNQLSNAGLTVDGQFGNNSRKALGEYQASLGLPATGFMNRPTQEAIRKGTEAGQIEDMEFIQGTTAGQTLSSVEDLVYNPYSLNNQPRLSGGRRHNSGLTIGAGFDLGQKNKQDLLNMGVSEELADKLDKSGWLGLRPSNAVEGAQDNFRTRGHQKMYRMYEEQAANGTLLTLTPQEIDELTRVEYDHHASKLEQAYEDAGYGSWDDLSDNAKIALTVERYHRGNLGSNWRTFFERARDNDVRGITDLYLYSERANPVLRTLGVD